MNEKKQTAEGRGVQSIEVGSLLLNALIERGEPMMLKELASVAGIASAQAHPYLVSFRNLGLVEQNGPAGRYQLGPFALDLAIARMGTFDPMELASQAAAELTERVGLTSLLSVWGAFGPTVVVIHEGEDQLHMNTKVGTVYSVTGTATGRAFASHLPEDMIRPLRSSLPKTVTDRCVGIAQPLDDEEMSLIRQTGIASVARPPVPGIHAIASPVFDHLGQLLAVITLVGDARILEESAASPFAQALVETTKTLSSELGYREHASDREFVSL